MKPSIVEKLGGLALMGGTYLGIGNQINCVAEFNVYMDVEAAHSILKAPYQFVAIVPFDLAMAY